MTTNRLLTVATLTALCGSPLLSQSNPAPSSAPAPSVNVQTQKFARGNVQYRSMGPGGPGEPGPRSDFRIGPPGMWWKNPDLAQKISLTADQQKKMDDIFQQSRLQLIDLKANVEKQEVMLEPMLAANPPDTNKVLAQIDHVAGARAELEKANARMLLGIRGVLTADQWTKLQAEQRERRMIFHFKGPDGPGGPGPRGPGAEGFRFVPEPPVSQLFAPPIPGIGAGTSAVLDDGTTVEIHTDVLPLEDVDL